jgi:hypothetical protein
MADRMDDDHSPIGGLSIWVGLASFFSNSQNRTQARDALKKAKEAERLEKEKRDEAEGKGLGSHSHRRFGSWFRSSPKKSKHDSGKRDNEGDGGSPARSASVGS